MLLIIFLGLYKSRKKEIIPQNAGNGKLVIGTYKETGDSSASKIFATFNNDKLVVEYELSPSFGEPFAGVYIYDSSSAHGTFDLSKYDYLTLRLTSVHGKRIPISLAVVPDSNIYPELKEHISYSVLVDHYGRDTIYHIPLSSFKIPSWWFREHHLTHLKESVQDFSNVKSIIIGSCQALPPNVKDVTSVAQLTFESSNNTLITVSLVALLLLVGLAFYNNSHRKEKNKSRVIDYKPLKIVKEKNKDLERVVNYIAGKYSDQELGLQQIQTALGLGGKAISKLIKDEYSLSFNDYLNQLRITEVKRLLKETNLPVSEIAYNVGYGNISHFNRVFKNLTGQSPKQFREEDPAGYK